MRATLLCFRFILPSRRLIAAALLLLGVGCGNQQARLQKAVPPDEDKFARNFIETLRAQRYDVAATMLEATGPGKAGEIDKNLRVLGGFLQKSTPRSVTIVRAATGANDVVRRSVLGYEVQIPTGWAVISLVVDRRKNQMVIAGVKVEPLPLKESLEQLTGFNFRHKTWNHFSTLVLAFASVGVMVWAFLACLLSPVRYKWLWLPVTLIGIGKIAFNWTTAQTALVPLMLWAGLYIRQPAPYNPWIITFTVPVGAIAFLALRKKLIAKTTATTATIPTTIAP